MIRFHSMSIRMISVRKMLEEQVLAGMRRDWRPEAWLLGMRNGAAAMDNSLAGPQIITRSYHVIQQFHSRCIPRSTESKQILVQQCSQRSKGGNNSSVHQ